MCYLSEDLRNVKPFRPLPFRKGNTVHKVYEEDYICKVGWRGKATYVDWTDKKGKLHTKHFLRIKWEELNG